MTKEHKSKIGLELILPITFIFGTALFITAHYDQGWLGLIILLPAIVFIFHIFLTTNYTINKDKLKIKCGFLFNQQIDINTIKKISETNNPLSSPATSLDRLEIVYGKYDSILISPKFKKEFIADIISINPNIEIKLKKRKSNKS